MHFFYNTIFCAIACFYTCNSLADNAVLLQQSILQQLSMQSETHFAFRQEKKLAMLAKPLITEGELQLYKSDLANNATTNNHRLVWDIQKPYRVRYELSRDLIKEIDDNGERSMSPDSNPLAAALSEAMIAALSGYWSSSQQVATLTADGTTTNWVLHITPRSTELQKLIENISVEGSNNTIRQIRILEANHDSTVIQLRVIPK